MTETQLPLTIVNNCVQSSLPLSDRGLAYGDGVFETMLLVEGKLPLWKFHCDRLFAGLKALAIDLTRDRLNEHLVFVQSSLVNSDSRILVHKLIVTRGQGGRGYLPDPASEPTLISQLTPISPDTHAVASGIEVHLCNHRLPEPLHWAGCKTLNQLDYVLASRERADTRFKEGLIRSNRNHLIEATARNLFLVQGRRLLTPRLDRCGVAGVMRRLIMEQLAPAVGLEVVEKNILIDTLASADEVFVCNSIQFIWPVTYCDRPTENPLSWAVGQVTCELQSAIDQWLQKQLNSIN